MDILAHIFEHKKVELEANKAKTPLDELRRSVADLPPTRGFHRTLVDSTHRPSLIAEVKKASPSKGIIRDPFDPVAVATAYEEAGADCLSVLTDVQFFQGAPDYLALCRDATRLPLLRKDFTIDEYDIWMARSLGADAVLLIVAGLEPSQLRDYRETAEGLGMDALVEAHTAEEAENAVKSGARLLGINNRDLKTFKTNIETTAELIPRFVGEATIVAESALETIEDVRQVGVAGARSVLIGTAFCRQPDVVGAVREVMGW